MSTKPNLPFTSSLIGLGGNVGDVVASMQRAINAIEIRRDCRVVAISRIYRTPPWGITEQDWFYNACAEVETSLEAEALLDLLLTIELAQGRVRDQRWGPRTLDLDIIAYGDAIIETERLSIPHPRMDERAFVVLPLMDICPERVISGKTVSDYAAGMDRGDIKETEETLKFGAI
ncbi:MAG: 2-amino-4-hydroxy-6-hydroxymethyldihydropteridine diphosphokinase [Pseudomonadota bacterium]